MDSENVKQWTSEGFALYMAANFVFMMIAVYFFPDSGDDQ